MQYNLLNRLGLRRTSKWKVWRGLRRAVQVLALVFFLHLLVISWAEGQAATSTSLFFRLNPLTALSATIASLGWAPGIGWAMLTIAVTLALGRVWCGWICPMGTILDWVRFPKAAQRALNISPKWRTAKYALLLLILGMALSGSLLLLIFDPITLLTRALATGLLPALNAAITQTEIAMYRLPFLRPMVSWLETVLRGPVLPTVQTAFAGGLVAIALWVGVMALNALADRFWCRYLCPLGGLLGLLAKVSFFKPQIQATCTACDNCLSACPMEAIQTTTGSSPIPREIIASECTLCMDCLTVCPASGIAYNWQRPDLQRQEYDPDRRQVLASLGTGVAGAVLLGTDASLLSPTPRLLRPPGVNDVDAFLAKCVRCGQCMQVCPTAGLQPSLFQAGLAGFGTPTLVPRLGACDYSCTACGQVCPTGAIPLLDLASKRLQVLGMAVVDRNRCLPWAYDTPCIVCEEMCPLPEKAIRLHETTVTTESGQEMRLQQPYVVLDLCIGCGLCENNCPMEAQAAIQVQRR